MGGNLNSAKVKMKTVEQIITELNKNEFFKANPVITTADKRFIDVFSFYIKYPQYEKLEANGVWWVLLALSGGTDKIRVHQLSNGSVWFMGDIFASKNAPIASIGEYTGAAPDSFSDEIKDPSTLIGEISL